MTKNTASIYFSTEFSIAAPKTWAWHFRIVTTAGFHQSDIWPFWIDPVWDKKKCGVIQSDVIKNGLVPYKINPEQSDWMKNVAAAMLLCRWVYVWVASLPVVSVQSDSVRQWTTELSTKCLLRVQTQAWSTTWWKERIFRCRQGGRIDSMLSVRGCVLRWPIKASLCNQIHWSRTSSWYYATNCT